MWSAEVNGKVVRATDEALDWFAMFFVHHPDLKKRMSRLFLFDAFVMNEAYGISPAEIMMAIKEVESGEIKAIIKPATPFRHPPLKGLWHKHFFAARFLAHNILNVIETKRGREALLQDVLSRYEGEEITEEIARWMAERTVRGTIDERAEAQKLTGEWIIFGKLNGTNYYLGISPHEAGDQNIFDRVAKFALPDFPELEAAIKSS